jgi:hypothetical protein
MDPRTIELTKDEIETLINALLAEINACNEWLLPCEEERKICQKLEEML